MAQNLQYAGEYQLKELLLHTSSGSVLPMTKAVQSIDIFEDMFSPSLSGTVTILDVDNMAENGPIIGQEYLTLRLATPSLDEHEIDIMFSVYKVGVREAVSQDTQLLSLSLTSPELLKNKQVRVSKSYTDTIHNIIDSVLRDQRYINTDKNIFLEQTSGIRKVVSPNLHPFDFIRNLVNEAQTEKDKSPYFFFFENLKGIQVKSLGAILAEETIGDFNVGAITSSQKDKAVTVDHDKDFARALEFQINSNNDMLLNTMSGLLGSTIIEYNIYNKSFTKNSYSYFDDFERFPRIDENPVFSNIEGEFDNSKLFCKGEILYNNDGSVKISVKDNSLIYFIEYRKAENSINSSTKTIWETSENTIRNLTQGTYLICIYIFSEPQYKQCFKINIDEPRKLSAFLDVDNDKRTTSIELGGSKSYNIEVNGNKFEVMGNNFTTKLSTGLNKIKISTKLECQGIIEKEIFISEEIHYYPNPTDKDVNIHVSGDDNDVLVSVFSEKGELIYSKEQKIQDFSRKTNINLSGQTTGLYIVVMESKTVRKTFKILKK